MLYVITVFFFFQAEDGIRDVEAHVQRSLSVFPLSGEAVQDAAESGGSPVVAQHLYGVVPRIFAVVRRPAMDDDWQAGGASLLHLPAKDLLLHLARRMIVALIQPYLAPTDDLGMFGEVLPFGIVGFARQLGFVRMNAQRREDPIMLFGNLDGAS